MAVERTPDTMNRFFVGAQGNRIRILRLAGIVISKEDALNLAAWLVALADEDGAFDALLAAIRAI